MIRDIAPTRHQPKVYPPCVLVVGRNSQRLMWLREKLEHQNYNVYSLNINDDHLAAIYQKHFDLVVLDVEVDNVGMVDSYHEFWANLAWLDAPVVMMSPDDMAKQVSDGLPLPIYHHISKDDSMASMLPIIEQIHYISYRYM